MLVAICHYADAYDGPGYYYSEEGSSTPDLIGAFDSIEEAVADAQQNGHVVTVTNTAPTSTATKSRITKVSGALPPQAADHLVPLMVPKRVYHDMVQHLAMLTRNTPAAMPSEGDELVRQAVEVLRQGPEKWFTYDELLAATGVATGKLRCSMAAFMRRCNEDQTRPPYRVKQLSGKKYYKYAG